MDLGLNGKRVVVAGASRGIGLAIADSFLREGALVAVVSRTAATLTEAADRLRAAHGRDRVVAFAADCARAADWAAITAGLQAEWGGIDVAIAAAGNGRSVPDALPDSHQFARTWNANFTTAEETARATVPLLQYSGGSLLFIGSIAGLQMIGAPVDYAVAKTAMTALAKNLATKLAPGVRVNCLAPGNIWFAGGSWDAKLLADADGVKAMISRSVPLQRFGTPEEVASAAVFLSSDHARFITGTCLVVDGGQTTRFL